MTDCQDAGAAMAASANDIPLPTEPGFARAVKLFGAEDPYQAFLRAKVRTEPPAGLPCSLDEVATHRRDGKPLRDHQRHIVRWGVQGGRRAFFLDFGLGKSTVQVETGRIILEKCAARDGDRCLGLIVGPLGCRSDMIADAAQLGVDLHFVREMDEVWSEFHRRGEAGDRRPLICLTNFETVRAGKIDLSPFMFASIDEAAALRDYGSETFQTFLPLFDQVPYRFVATALPDPNRDKELLHYAAFLGIMDSGQALTRFFQRNSEKAGELTLMPHMEDAFWLWVSSWAVFLEKPSDLGFSDEGYVKPKLTLRWHKVGTDIAAAEAEPNGQGRLMRDAALGVVDASREKRRTLPDRIAKLAEIVRASPDDHFLLWHDLEDERKAILAALGPLQCAQVFGSQKLEVNEAIADDFRDGHIQRLAAKPSMLGAGRNFQYHCHRAIFAGIGFKFHDWLQAIMRIWRFLQVHEVEIDLIYAETETEVRRRLEERWERHQQKMARMGEIIRRFGLNHAAAAETMKRSIGCDRVEERSEAEVDGQPLWTMVHNDCVDEVRRLANDSVDLIVTSIPFGNHYEYSPSYNDFGHTEDHGHFFGQMDFLTPELLRILKPGRLALVHVKDRIQFASVTGLTRPTVEPFHADTIAHFRRHGFGYMGLRFIATDVVRENNQTYRLTYKELRKDATRMGSGSPEFLLCFFKLPTDRSRGYADEPVAHEAEEYSLARWQIDADALWRSSGDRPLTPAELAAMPADQLARSFAAWIVQDVYDHEAHVAVGEGLAARDALPKTFSVLKPNTVRPDVWTDVARMRTLNGEQSRRGLENHICPLQFDIVDRAIRLYSNPGELVLDPFAGLGTVPMRAVALGRRGYGVELSPKYFPDAVRYCREAEAERAVPSLFDLLGERRAA
jgi:DNA modification methylase